MKWLKMCVIAAFFFAGIRAAGTDFRFPMPEFETGYQHPDLHIPATNLSNPALDIAVLFAALSLSAWLALKRRSRSGLFLLTLFSLAYFGFWRKGCVCPVGSVQNIASAIFDPSFQVPVVVSVFFLLPLVFALFFGRVFCAAVCPLGAVQEVAAIRPLQVPQSLDSVLRLIPYLYLGLTVLSVAMGSGFLICRYDPFVGFFREGASFNMFLVGGIFLLAGVFVGRPYCRFLCPYGVLLGWVARFAKWPPKIYPTKCIQCRLCEEACPYGAINAPAPEQSPIPRREGGRRLGLMLLITPFIIAFGAWSGMMSHTFLARLHPTIQLAERIIAEEHGDVSGTTIESDAFRSGKMTAPQLFAEAEAIRSRFRSGSAWFGAFLGLTVSGKLIGLSLVRRSKDYETDRHHCVACARCFAYCPVGEESFHGSE